VLLVDAADRAHTACSQLEAVLSADIVAKLENARNKKKVWEAVKAAAPKAARPNDSRGKVFDCVYQLQSNMRIIFRSGSMGRSWCA
jgi:hypothetical protein